jgi:uncharacterized protein (TIGR00297 family)
LGHGLPLRNLALPALISALFALFAWLLRGVTASGALAGFGIAFALYAEGGWPWFVLLLFVFLLTWAATHAGRRRKAERGLADPHDRRDAVQVVANVGLAAYLAVLPLRFEWVFGLIVDACALAVLAEAAADTCASEIGKAYGNKTWLITTRKEVPPGTDGGVSWWGIVAALVAAAATAGLAGGVRISLWPEAYGVAALAATLATFVDSALGATLERRGRLSNDGVNLLSTAAAAGLTALVLLVFDLICRC